VPLSVDAGTPQLFFEAMLDAVGEFGFMEDFGDRAAGLTGSSAMPVIPGTPPKPVGPPCAIGASGNG
jgi:hypothetical protein